MKIWRRATKKLLRRAGMFYSYRPYAKK